MVDEKKPEVVRSYREEDLGDRPRLRDQHGLSCAVSAGGRLPRNSVARFTVTKDRESWRVQGLVGRTRLDGPLVLVSVTIDPGDFVGGVTPELVKRIRLRDVREAVLAQLEYTHEWQEVRARLGWPLASEEERKRLQAGAEAPPVSRGRPMLPDEFLYGIAREYLELLAAGYGHARGKGILNEMAGRRGRPRETVRDWIAKARARGFLTAGVPGEAGADPGPAYELFERERKEEA